MPDIRVEHSTKGCSIGDLLKCDHISVQELDHLLDLRTANVRDGTVQKLDVVCGNPNLLLAGERTRQHQQCQDYLHDAGMTPACFV